MFEDICAASTLVQDSLAPSFISYFVGSVWLSIAAMGLLGLLMGPGRKGRRSAWLFIITGVGIFAIWTGLTKHNSNVVNTLYESGEHTKIEGRVDEILSRAAVRRRGDKPFRFVVGDQTVSVKPGWTSMAPGRPCQGRQCQLEIGDYVRVTRRWGRVLTLERCDRFVEGE